MKTNRKKICFLLFLIIFGISCNQSQALEQCFREASSMYGINVDILKSIAKVESGYNQKAVNINQNGTRDYGVMQINSTWKDVLGETAWFYVVNDACYNIKVGAWILSLNIKKEGNNWGAIGSYNAKSYRKKLSYIRKVHKTYISLNKKNLQKNENI